MTAQVGDVTQRLGTVESVDGSIYVAGFNIYQSSIGVIKTMGLGSIVTNACDNLEMAGTISSGSGNLAMGAGQMVIDGILTAGNTLILSAHAALLPEPAKPQLRILG